MRVFACALVLLPSFVVAQDLNAGFDAYDAGNYLAALEHFQTFAMKGDAAARYHPGFVDNYDQDVPENQTQALAWLRLAEEKGRTMEHRDIGTMPASSKSPSEPTSLIGGVLEDTKKLLIAACDGRPDCILTVTSVTLFIWSNRDELNPAALGYKITKCMGISAVKRGYLFSPIEFLEDMTPAVIQEVTSELCSCVLGYWAKQACKI